MFSSQRDIIRERWRGYYENHLKEESRGVVFGAEMQNWDGKDILREVKYSHFGKGVIKRSAPMRYSYKWKCEGVWEATRFA